MKRDHVDRLCLMWITFVHPAQAQPQQKHIILCTHKRHSYESNELYIYFFVCRAIPMCVSLSLSLCLCLYICLRFVSHLWVSLICQFIVSFSFNFFFFHLKYSHRTCIYIVYASTLCKSILNQNHTLCIPWNFSSRDKPFSQY